VPVNQQLAHIPLLGRRSPQTWKPALHQQLQNVSRITPVGLLPAHIAGPNLSRIAYPDNVTQPLHQLDQPLAVSTRLNPN
jgi:hypothetical protein